MVRERGRTPRQRPPAELARFIVRLPSAHKSGVKIALIDVTNYWLPRMRAVAGIVQGRWCMIVSPNPSIPGASAAKILRIDR